MGLLTNIVIPVAVSLLIHALIFAALISGWQQQRSMPKIVPPTYIEAKLVQLEDQSKKKATAKKQPKKIDLTAKRKEQARLKREEEAKRQAQIRKQKAAADKKAAEKKRQEEDKTRREREKQAQREREQQRLQQQFQEALEEEQGLLQEEEFANEAQSYISKFRQRVESKWSRPPSARTGMRCTLRIQLVPTGRIVSVDVVESSGNPAFDRSAVQAVKKVELFPEVKEMSSDVFERYYRNFKFLFNPQDLRL